MAVRDVEDQHPDRAIDVRVGIGQRDVKEPLLSRLLTGGCDSGAGQQQQGDNQVATAT